MIDIFLAFYVISILVFMVFTNYRISKLEKELKQYIDLCVEQSKEIIILYEEIKSLNIHIEKLYKSNAQINGIILDIRKNIQCRIYN